LNVKELPYIKKELQEDGIYPEVSSMMLKGYLFYELTEEWYDPNYHPNVNCPQINPNHLYGWWCIWKSQDFNDILLLDTESQTEFKINKKNNSRWIFIPKHYGALSIILVTEDMNIPIYDYQQLKEKN